jgi:hypothetical protein
VSHPGFVGRWTAYIPAGSISNYTAFVEKRGKKVFPCDPNGFKLAQVLETDALLFSTVYIVSTENSRKLRMPALVCEYV